MANVSLLLRLANLAAIIGVFVVNGLANALPINGKTTGELSDANPTFITPAGYAFSIWGLIYFFLAVFAIYQFFPAVRSNYPPIDHGLSFGVVISCILNITWILVWQYEKVRVSLAIMLLLLLSLDVMYYRMTKYAKSWVEYLCVHVWLSLYLGWIICAALVNVFVVATDTTSEEYQSAGAVGVVVAAVLGLIILAARKDPIPAAVVVWALVAIDCKQLAIHPVSVTSAVCAGILTLAIIAFCVKSAVDLRHTKQEGYQIGQDSEPKVRVPNEERFSS